MQIEREIIALMEKAFNIDINTNIDNCTPEMIEGWDSITYLDLILLLEEHFKVMFDPEEMLEMVSGGRNILNAIRRKVQGE